MRSKLAVMLLILMLFVSGVAVTAVAARQYQGSSCETALDDIIQLELRQTHTTTIAITVNNVLRNILNVGNSPSRRYDTRGYPIVVLNADQAVLPVVGAAAGYIKDNVILSLEDTDYDWGVKVEKSGLFLTNFPTYLFPPGSYYMTICGARIFRLEIPEDYAPVVPDRLERSMLNE